MDEQLRNALVSQDVKFVKELLKPSGAPQPPAIDYEALSNQLLKYEWLMFGVVDLREPELTRLFLRGNDSMNVDDGLRRAVYNFDVDHVRLFLQEFNADPNSFDGNLHTPIYHLYSDISDALTLDPQLIFDKNDEAVEIMKMLIDRGAIIVNNVDGFNELQVTGILKHGTAEAVSIILDMDEIGLIKLYDGGWTVAHLLAGNRNPNTLTLLQDRDFHADSRDHYGCTPLWMAAANGVSQAVEFLLKKGADVNIPSNNITPLGIATYKYGSREVDYTECILLLLEHGADVQAQIWEDLYLPATTIFDVLGELEIDQRPSEVIMQHLALQAAIGTTITERVQNTINLDPDLKEKLDDSRQLLQSRFFESHTLFAVLTCGEEKLVSLMRKEQLAEKLQSYLQSISSIYYNRLLQKRLTKAGQIIELRGKAAFVVGKLMEVDYYCQPGVVDIVLSYLNLEDLNTLLSL